MKNLFQSIPKNGQISLAALIALIALASGFYLVHNHAWEKGLVEGMQWYHSKCYGPAPAMIKSRADGTIVICTKGD